MVCTLAGICTSVSLFENNLYFDIAKHQNELSELLVEKLKEEDERAISEAEETEEA